MATTTHLGIVHRNRLFRECLASVLALQPSFTVTDLDVAEDGVNRVAAETGVTIWLVDIALPDGLAIAVIRALQQRSPSTKVLALVSAAADEAVVQCVAAGAQGCILEDASIAELQEGIRKVTNGEVYCSHGIVHCMFRHVARTARESQWQQQTRSADLTSRELEILDQIANHQTNKQIAKRLSVSLHTVKNHVHHILEKLQVQNRSQAANYARHHNWPTPTRLES